MHFTNPKKCLICIYIFFICFIVSCAPRPRNLKQTPQSQITNTTEPIETVETIESNGPSDPSESQTVDIPQSTTKEPINESEILTDTQAEPPQAPPPFPEPVESPEPTPEVLDASENQTPTIADIFEDAPHEPPHLVVFNHKLLWEKNNPKRKVWSRYILNLIYTELLENLNHATDAPLFCGKYRTLNRVQKTIFWGELIAAISFFESSHNPIIRFREKGLGIDRVTGKPVYSEGLLQLSYGDTLGHKYCKFDWDADKSLPPDSLERSILNPINNLDCGVRILNRQIQRRKKIATSIGAYWMVIKPSGTYQKISQIKKITQSLPFCH